MAIEMSDEILIPAPRERVYAALLDPAVLKASIPGCEAIEHTSDTTLDATVVLRIGPVKARFRGTVTLDPEGAPARFGLTGEGSGGVAGFARGGAEVTLAEEEGGTRLAYRASADVGGKLAQLGNRLVGGTARKLSAQFFENFAAAVTAEG